MTGRDPSLTIPTLPSLSRGTGSPSFPLERTPRIEHDPPFGLRGRGLRVAGGHARGVDAVRGDVALRAHRLAVDGAIAERSMTSPLGLERQLTVGGVEVTERVVVSPAGPVAFFEWIVSDDVGLDIRWHVPVRGARWHAGDGGIVVEAAAARGLFLLSRPPTRLSIGPPGTDGSTDGDAEDAASDLIVAARFDLMAGERVLVAIAEVAAGANEARVLRVMGRPHVVVPAGRAAALRTLESTLALDVPDDPLSEALSWAKLSLATEANEGGAMERGQRISRRWHRIALAGLAVGDASAARALIRTGGAEREGDARWLLLVARYLAWTGDLALVKEQWARVAPHTDRLVRQMTARAAHVELGLGRRALTEIAVAAEEVGDGALATRLRAVVGDDAAEGGAAGGEEGGEEAVRGESDDADVGLESAAVVERAVGEVLRVEPDAPRGRLVLRPRLPSSWSRCDVRSLIMGQAVVELEYRAEGDVHAWAVRQRSGGAPITLIFEPELPGARVLAARVDGAVASLDAVAVDGRVRVPVQLVLDHERRVEVEIEGPDD